MFAAVVLAGGAAVRLGGTSKPGRTVGGVRLLDRVLATLTGADPVVVVGPPELLLPPDVRRTMENPPGGGPVAALAAGMALLAGGAVPAGGPMPGPAAGLTGEVARPPDLVAVLAADLPFLTAATVAGLRAAAGRGDHDGAVLVDETGRPQWLCGVWRGDALTRRLAEIADPAGWGWRQLADGLRVATVPPAGVPPAEGPLAEGLPASGPPAWFDCDTEADSRQAEEWIDGQPR